MAGTQHIDPDTKDFSAVATQVKSSGADVVYYGGEYPQAGPLSKQIKAAGAKIPLVGGDGIYSATFIKLAGASATGDLATSVGAPVEDARPPPRSSSPTTRPRATRRTTRRTAATPTTRPGRSSRP